MLEVLKCPACSETYSPSTQFCLQDGTPLEVAQTLIGRVLDDRYRIEWLMGEGGMGTVYGATHIQLDDKVAVKVLNPEMIRNENAIKRFRREARAARLIKHQNAVEVTDFGVTSDNLVYLVMEIVDGRNLRELLREGVFEYRHAAKLLIQVCDTIEAAHQKGIIHRDLKPENIMVQGEGKRQVVKVLDFGIAKLLEDDAADNQQGRLTKAGMILGTPQYMSPEQCRGKNLGPPSDIYAIGIIAYEMLSGRPPFTGNSASDYLVKHLHNQPPELRSFAPLVPESLAREIMQTLEKDPADRPQTANDLALRLGAAVRKADGRSTGDPEAASHETIVDEEGLQPTLVDSPAAPTSKPLMRAEDQTTTKTNEEVAHTRDPRLTKAITSESETMEVRKPGRIPLIGAVAIGVLVLGLIGYWAVAKQSTPTPAPPPPPPENMSLIKGGKFLMGRDGGDSDESPVHEVVVDDFFIDKYEVTNQQYKACVDARKCVVPRNWKNGVFEPEDALLPVTFVTWEDANGYARWADKRLPKEAEWEYVARGGGKTTLYPWGEQWHERGANVGRAGQRPLPGGSFDQDQNAGVFDLIGNVSEWVEDSYTNYDGTISPCATCKVYRGGSFADRIEDSSATHRFYTLPTAPADPQRYDMYENTVLRVVGFRCARDAK